MFRYLSSLLVGTLALAGGTYASAAEPSPTVWPKLYRPLPLPDGSVYEAISLDSSDHLGEARGLELPFPFEFGGVESTSLNVGMKGYVSFGEGNSASSTSPLGLLMAGEPARVIAAWWGDHLCDLGAGELGSQTIGVAPERVHIIEWRCLKRGGADPSSFEAQLWFYEGAPVVRAVYGDARIGIGNDWTAISWGTKSGSEAGELGPNRDGDPAGCSPDGAGGSRHCSGRDDFPHQSVIQYGFLPGATPVIGAVSSSMTVADRTMELSFRATLKNVGLAAVGEVRYVSYLAEDVFLLPGGAGTFGLGSGSTSIPAAEGVAAGETRLEELFYISPPAGGYFACLALLGTNEQVIEHSCDPEKITWGADLVAFVLESPTEGEPAGEISLHLRIRNNGGAAAPAFEIRVVAEPDELPPGINPAYPEEIFRDRLEGLASGESLELVYDGVERPKITLPPILRGDRYRFVFTVDPGNEIEDINRVNNVAYSFIKMRTRKPHLQVTENRISLEFAHGECVYGEPVEAVLEICNRGESRAENFQPGIILGEEPFISFLDDAVSASYPQTCHSPFSRNHVACEEVNGARAECAFESCRIRCEQDGDCPSSLHCLEDRYLEGTEGSPAKSCMVQIERRGPAGSALPCQEFRVKGVVPAYSRLGRKHRTAEQYIHFLGDTHRALSETKAEVVTTERILCKEYIADLEPIELNPPREVTAGEGFPVSRLIRNLGYVEQDESGARRETFSFRYRYYLSPVGVDVSPGQIPLVVQATGGAGVATVGLKGDNLFTDVVVIPHQVVAGDYMIGLIVDPDDELRENSKANNRLTYPLPITVRNSSFRIARVALPAATKGGHYTFQFQALGGTSTPRWSATGLPAGLDLDSQGLLSGTPRDAGDFGFTVKVVSGDLVAEQTVALRVLEPRGTLSIATELLPPAVRGRAYGGWLDAEGLEREGIPLAAMGGIPPYSWELLKGSTTLRLPQGLRLQSPEGIILGEPSPLSTTSSFVVRVRDAAGGEASRELNIQVVDESDLNIRDRFFDGGMSADDYVSCIRATGGGTLESYQWTADESTIPSGLVAEVRGDQLCLIGTPDVCGNYMVKVAVADSLGKSYETSLPLTIECDIIYVNSRFSRPFARGEEVEIVLGSSAGAGAHYALYQGSLPLGLSLSGAGVISGTIDLNANSGAYDFIVEVSDEAGRRGLTALTMVVSAEARVAETVETTKPGCSAAGGESGWLLGAALVGFAILRRSKEVKRAGGGVGLAAALLVVLGGCGETREIVTKPLCAGVLCDGSLECDPSDGLCKCGGGGGVECKAGEICLVEPEPTCSTVSCEWVVCEGGQSCNPSTGLCSCGEEVCEDGEVCIGQRCTRGELCEEVNCGVGLSCDPTDGECKCSNEICYPDQSCVEGKCVEDLCAGLSCGGSGVCNPEDGSCHCESVDGPICQGAEVCLRIDESHVGEGVELTEPMGFACLLSEKCDGVVCEGGTTCDPADGACRCGGIGALAPACAPGQSCVAGQCRGGDLCETEEGGVVCDGGNSCDPIDGACKCGGMDGLICERGDACTYVGGEFQCAKSCTIVLGAARSCDAGQGCYLDRALGHGRAFCAEAGPMKSNEACESFNDCEDGFYCSAANLCRRFCRPSEDPVVGCGNTPGAFCLPFTANESEQEDLGYCIIDFG